MLITLWLIHFYLHFNIGPPSFVLKNIYYGVLYFAELNLQMWIHQQVAPTSWGLIGRNMFSRGVLPIAFVYNKQGQVLGRFGAGLHDRHWQSFHYLAQRCELLI